MAEQIAAARAATGSDAAAAALHERLAPDRRRPKLVDFQAAKARRAG